MQGLIDAALTNYASNTARGKHLVAFVQLSAAVFLAFAWALMDRGVDLVCMQYTQLAVDDTANPPTITVSKSLSKVDRVVADIQPPIVVVSSSTTDDTLGDNFGGKYCLNTLLTKYVAAAACAPISIDITVGFLFRAVQTQNRETGAAGVSSTDHVSTDAMRRTVKALCKQTGVPWKGIHGTRYGKATSLRAAGASSPSIQSWGGWRGPAMVDHYTGASAAAQRGSKKRRRQDNM